MVSEQILFGQGDSNSSMASFSSGFWNAATSPLRWRTMSQKGYPLRQPLGRTRRVTMARISEFQFGKQKWRTRFFSQLASDRLSLESRGHQVRIHTLFLGSQTRVAHRSMWSSHEGHSTRTSLSSPLVPSIRWDWWVPTRQSSLKYNTDHCQGGSSVHLALHCPHPRLHSVQGGLFLWKVTGQGITSFSELWPNVAHESPTSVTLRAHWPWTREGPSARLLHSSRAGLNSFHASHKPGVTPRMSLSLCFWKMGDSLHDVLCILALSLWLYDFELFHLKYG